MVSLGFARQAQNEGAVDDDAELVAVLGEAARHVDPHALLDVVQDLLIAGLVADQQQAQAIVLHHLQRLARHIGLGVARPGDAELAQLPRERLDARHDCRSACRRRRRFPSPAGKSFCAHFISSTTWSIERVR